MMLETHVAAMAAERGTDAEIAPLEQLMDRWVAAGDDVGAASLVDVDFHRAIATSAHNELYLVLLDSIAGALLENRRATLALQHSHAKVLGEHRAIVNAIAAHDPDEARAAMQKHLHGVEEAWRAQQPPSGATP
jgi:DNA-binding FadR family transcriptional regulator